MKTLKAVSVLLLTVLLFTGPIFAGDELNPKVKANYKTIEANLLVGLNSDNEGLKISCAYYLGEMKSEKAVFALSKILREDNSYPARIIAALSLIKIGNPQGVYLVHRTSLFNNMEGVRKMSAKFYLSYLLQKYIEEHPDKAADFAYIKF